MALTIVALAAVAGAVVELRTPLLPDSSWLLWLARRWLDGATLYRDVWEINPPLAVWLHAPVVLVARAAGWPVGMVFRAAVMLWAAGCLLLLDRVFSRWEKSPLDRNAALAAASVVVFALAGPFFGQREHLILAAAIPWVALTAARRGGQSISSGLAIAIAAVMAVGIALKPMHVGLWLMVPLLGSGHRWWRWPEFWLVPVLGVVYLGVVASGTEYFAYAREWGPVYWRFRHVSFLRVAVGNELAALPPLAIMIALAVRSRSPMTLALICATAATWIGAVLQAKALPYHYWPADALAMLLLGAASRLSRLALVPVMIVWIAGVLSLAVDGSSTMRGELAELESATAGRSALILGSNNDSAWLLVNESGQPWLSPHYCLWWLQLSRGRDTVAGLPRWKAQDSTLRASLLPRKAPDLLLLETGPTSVEKYLERSPAWRELLAGYSRGGTVSGYRVFTHLTAAR